MKLATSTRACSAVRPKEARTRHWPKGATLRKISGGPKRTWCRTNFINNVNGFKCPSTHTHTDVRMHTRTHLREMGLKKGQKREKFSRKISQHWQRKHDGQKQGRERMRPVDFRGKGGILNTLVSVGRRAELPGRSLKVMKFRKVCEGLTRHDLKGKQKQFVFDLILYSVSSQ